MKQHIKIYFDALGLDPYDNRQECELTGFIGVVDIHHIQRRGMGGSKKLDRIENLMALNRKDHDYLGEKQHFKSMLFRKHMHFLERNNVKFDKEYMLNQIARYE
ncbi:hypothetical protein PL373_13530 [Tenacibaculum maritimum]|nr:hypothetical protein [Tenacibaculum maritimum]MDB0602151.1 hypothetical protein [Tenacibaculum maritimum]MDB0613826.1 hypothetical protein [Tenacibaculum maritimum]